MERRYWPQGATCATQEASGEVFYWDAPVDVVEEGRKVAGKHGMMAEIGLKHQVDAWYADMDEPQLATDWSVAVITPTCFLFAYDARSVTKKMLELIANSPQLKGLEYDLVMVGELSDELKRQLSQANQVLKSAGIRVEAMLLQGGGKHDNGDTENDQSLSAAAEVIR